MEFEGKVAVITGGGRGLGAATATAFVERGARVTLLDVDQGVVEETASELEQKGYDALGLVCDIRDEHAVERVVRQTHERFGRVDILINSAALHRRTYHQPFGSLERDDVRALFETNVIGVINTSLAVRPYMAEVGGGVIINISSTAGHTSVNPYGVSKLAVRGLTVAFAYEFGLDGIRVNAISPGFVGTAGSLSEYDPERLMVLISSHGVRLPAAMVEKASPQDLADVFMGLHRNPKREGRPDDIVQGVLYLCSDAAGFVTGETLKIGGGTATGFC